MVACEYAKQLILQGAAKTITLQALSLQCGFASQKNVYKSLKAESRKASIT
jgi:hypothetical protein